MVSGGQDSIALLEILAGPLLGRLSTGLRPRPARQPSPAGRGERRRSGPRGSSLPATGHRVDRRAPSHREGGRERAGEGAGGPARGGAGDGRAERVRSDSSWAIRPTIRPRTSFTGWGATAAWLRCAACSPAIRPGSGLCWGPGGRRRPASAARDGLVYAVDRGNAYPGYARTGLREQVLPAWEAVLPGAVEGAARTAEVAAEVESLVREAVACLGDGGRCSLPRRPAVGRALARPCAVWSCVPGWKSRARPSPVPPCWPWRNCCRCGARPAATWRAGGAPCANTIF